MPLRKKRRANPEGRMALKDHLKEARNRLFVILAVLLLTTIAGFFLYQPVMDYLVGLVARLGGRVNYSTAVSPLDVMVKVSLWIGLILASPVILYQIWAFITPGLMKKERWVTIGFLAASIPLFLGGVALGVYVIPHALAFFLGLTPHGADNLIQVGDFLPFIIRLTLAFGVAMVIPVAMVGLNMLGVLPVKSILKHWRITVFLIALFAAVAAPGGDAMSMIVLAVPMFVLFALAIGLCALLDRRRAKRGSLADEDLESSLDTAIPIKDL